MVRYAANKDELYVYPAFVDTLDPCCFQVTSANKNISTFFGKAPKQKTNVKWTLQWPKLLEKNRKGTLPPILLDIFGNNKPGFVRIGTIPNPFCFFEILTLISKGKDNVKTILAHIVNSLLLNPEIFKTIANGSLEVIFSDPEHRITPLQNFLEATVSDNIKPDYLYIDLFREIGLPSILKSLQIIIISIEKVDDINTGETHEHLYVRCTPGSIEGKPSCRFRLE